MSRLRFAYADPPYIGQAKRHYGPDAQEVNHRVLLGNLMEYDGWALSLSSPSLEEILGLCREVCGPHAVRVAAWVKPFAAFKRGVDPAYAWEPIIYQSRREWRAEQPTCRDFVSAAITLERGTHGAKPDAFSFWLFELLGMRPTDEFTDLFPGSGAVTRAHERWRNQLWAANA